MSTKAERDARAERILYGPRSDPRPAPWLARCTRCKLVKDREKDYSKTNSGTRRSTVCKACRASEARDRRARKKAQEVIHR